MKVRELIKYLADQNMDSYVVFHSKSEYKTWENLEEKHIRVGQGILIFDQIQKV
jgi:hypothetical protein